MDKPFLSRFRWHQGHFARRRTVNHFDESRSTGAKATVHSVHITSINSLHPKPVVLLHHRVYRGRNALAGEPSPPPLQLSPHQAMAEGVELVPPPIGSLQLITTSSLQLQLFKPLIIFSCCLCVFISLLLSAAQSTLPRLASSIALAPPPTRPPFAGLYGVRQQMAHSYCPRACCARRRRSSPASRWRERSASSAPAMRRRRPSQGTCVSLPHKQRSE